MGVAGSDSMGAGSSVVGWCLVAECIPERLADYPTWGNYLTARAQHVQTTAEIVRANLAATEPAWAERIADASPPTC